MAIEDDQHALWNGIAGNAWVDAQETLDAMLRPFEELLVAAATGERVLDVGCGTGSTTIALARARGHCTGVDISEPMIALGRTRAEREHSAATFVCADAETHPFAPASHDMIVSRFGVMFFSDPVRAFTNLRRAASPGTALRVIAWRSPAENPFMTAAERAAAPLLPPPPPRDPDAPGQFAFADDRRVLRILEESGWIEPDIQRLDVACTFPEDALLRYVMRLGPLGRMLAQVDESARAPIIEAARKGLDPFVHGAEVRFTAACWNVGARTP